MFDDFGIVDEPNNTVIAIKEGRHKKRILKSERLFLSI